MARRRSKTLEERTKSNVVLGVLLILSTLVSALLVLGSASIGVHEWAKRTLDWRDQEYGKLRSLHAGYTRAKFESVLGEPVFDRETRNGQWREQTYKRREHWVQTISTRSGTVVLYSVTACGDEFRPKFDVTGAGRAEAPATVTLNSSKLSDVASATAHDYYGSGATANSRFYDVAIGSNPSNYKTFIWGLNDICPNWFNEVYPSIYKDRRMPGVLIYKSRDLGNLKYYMGRTGKPPRWIHRLRERHIANTYAETAPLFYLRELPADLQVGPDRILTRTTGE